MINIQVVARKDGDGLHYLLDNRLSLKAKGLMSSLIYLSNHGDSGVIQIMDIIKERNDSYYNAIDEMKKLKYYKKELKKNEKGQFSGANVIIYETPYE